MYVIGQTRQKDELAELVHFLNKLMKMRQLFEENEIIVS